MSQHQYKHPQKLFPNASFDGRESWLVSFICECKTEKESDAWVCDLNESTTTRVLWLCSVCSDVFISLFCVKINTQTTWTLHTYENREPKRKIIARDKEMCVFFSLNFESNRKEKLKVAAVARTSCGQWFAICRFVRIVLRRSNSSSPSPVESEWNNYFLLLFGRDLPCCFVRFAYLRGENNLYFFCIFSCSLFIS